MSDKPALNIGPALGWQLRAEFWATASRGDDRQLPEEVAETLRELNVPSLQLERIQNTLLEAVQRALLRNKQAGPVSPVHVRIWVAGECASGRCWGFFLVEKRGCDLQGVAGEAERLVELFLYQERGS